MSQESQRSLRELFCEAVEIEEASARAAFLDEACGSDLALRLRVDELLAADDGGQADLTTPSAAAKPEVVGERVGRYKLLQQIGEGGCGVVFMAQQEHPVRRQIALKLIKLGMDTRQVVARFEAERQALALMDHPNIARVLDVGAADSGRPYFVMELVRGVKITTYCDRHRLSTPQRLELFIQVCQAVQHAHQKGIIHRDLKPSNILVTELDGKPLPKVIDFGIAKAVEGRLTDHTLYTAFEQFLGTPAYMSPEQAGMAAADIDTRSDVYSLGVLLYELLTGRTPFDTKALLAAGLDEMRLTIREREPLRPSTRLSSLAAEDLAIVANTRQSEPPRLVHLVRGDLDWIVMKCLEKDRSRRYETANALATDLKRHLSNEPVLARPRSKLYEFQKTARRHKLGFGATAAVMAALLIGVLISAQAAARARRAEDQARRGAYLTAMNAAGTALHDGKFGVARELLRQFVPRSGELDLRRWEWRHLAFQSGGDPHISLNAHSGDVSNVRYLDDNTLLTTGYADWRTILWNLGERRISRVITNQDMSGGVSGIFALAAKHHVLFYRTPWSTSRVVKSVDLLAGVESDFRMFDATVTSLAVAPDESLLAVAKGQQIDLWDLDSKTNRPAHFTGSSDFSQVLFTPDGRELVAVYQSARIEFWSLADHSVIGAITDAAGSFANAFSPGGKWLINPAANGTIRIYRADDRSLVKQIEDRLAIRQLAFSPDGRSFAAVGGDSSVRVWDLSNWSKRVFNGHSDVVTSAAFSPDSLALATGARNGEVKLWSLNKPPDQPTQFPKSDYLQFASDGSAFLRVSELTDRDDTHYATNMEIWSTTPLKRIGTVPTSDLAMRRAALLPGGRAVAIGCADGAICIRGITGEKNITVANAHHGMSTLDVSADGSRLVSVAGDGALRLWRLPEMELIAEMSHAEHIYALKLSNDGKLLAAFSGPGDMGVWRLPSFEGPPMWPAFGPLQNVKATAFSPDSRRLAAAIENGEAFVWDLATRKRLALPRALTHYTSLSFSPDGSRLAAGCLEGDSKLFDAETCQEVCSFKQPSLQLAFCGDGERLVAIHSEGAFVFEAPPLERLHFDWLIPTAPEEPLEYTGPVQDYDKPQPPSARKSR